MVYFIKHYVDRISRLVEPSQITQESIRRLVDLKVSETNFKEPEKLPSINHRDWPRTMELIEEHLRSVLCDKMMLLAYVVRDDEVIPPSDEDPASIYLSPQDEMIARAPP